MHIKESSDGFQPLIIFFVNGWKPSLLSMNVAKTLILWVFPALKGRVEIA